MNRQTHDSKTAAVPRTCFLRRPTDDMLQAFLAREVAEAPSYREVGQSDSDAPAGYRLNELRTLLGSGEQTFVAARAALGRWTPFALSWVGLFPPRPIPQAGETFMVVARCLGLWCVNACRVVRVLEDERRFALVCGTLPGHAAVGEERFTVGWDERDGSVWYEVRSFSRPRHLLARLGIGYLRMVQRRFARQSAAAMLRVMGHPTG